MKTRTIAIQGRLLFDFECATNEQAIERGREIAEAFRNGEDMDDIMSELAYVYFSPDVSMPDGQATGVEVVDEWDVDDEECNESD